MTLFAGSRYRFGNVIQVKDSVGNVEAVHALRATTIDPPVGSRYYTTQAEDTFESLAYKEYGDSNKWYVLADANPSIFWTLDLEPGTEIIIPPKTYAAVV